MSFTLNFTDCSVDPVLPLTITNEQWWETNYVAIDSYTIIHDGSSYVDG